MLKTSVYEVIIIGSGPAGMTAAIYCARKGLKTLIIGKDVGGQMAKSAEIENYLGFGMSTGTELTKAFHEHVKKFANIEHVHDVIVTNLRISSRSTDKSKIFKIISAAKEEYQAKSVIIASGRNPRKLNVPGELEYRNKGVSYCATCDGPLFKNKITAVIGAGNSALETVISLAGICPTVYIVNIGSKLGGDKILQDKIKTLKNVRIINNAQTQEFIGDKFVTGLKYKDTESNKLKEIKVAGIFIEIGWIPSIDFDKLTKKNKLNEIIIDKQCRTTIPGIFAAGDITDTGYWQIIIAGGEGAKAALSAFSYLQSE